MVCEWIVEVSTQSIQFFLFVSQTAFEERCRMHRTRLQLEVDCGLRLCIWLVPYNSVYLSARVTCYHNFVKYAWWFTFDQFDGSSFFGRNAVGHGKDRFDTDLTWTQIADKMQFIYSNCFSNHIIKSVFMVLFIDSRFYCRSFWKVLEEMVVGKIKWFPNRPIGPI